MFSVHKDNISVNLISSFDQHQAEVWRLEWNISGTVLASSGDDGTVRLWKADLDGVWSNVSTVQGNEYQNLNS
jgi:nucleoporin SEH1